jgi:hypothetical protein
VGLGLAVVVGGEAGGESTRPVGGAGGVDVHGDVELLEGADVLDNKKRVRHAWLLVCCSVCTHSHTDYSLQGSAAGTSVGQPSTVGQPTAEGRGAVCFVDKRSAMDKQPAPLPSLPSFLPKACTRSQDTLPGTAPGTWWLSV